MMSTRLGQYITEKMAWNTGKIAVLADNVARADMPGEVRQDITPFNQTGKGNFKTTLRMPDRGIGIQPGGSSSTGQFQRIKTGEEIGRDQEALQVQTVATENQGLIGIYRRMGKMYQSISGKGG